MDLMTRIEEALHSAVTGWEAPGAPPRLAAAVRAAVFPGGARIRPRLCLAVAAACGEPPGRLAIGAATAIELLHCASLVHDDLPCFDNAPIRRGLPSVHRAYGERLAVLAGDALIVLAFETLAEAAAEWPRRLAPLTGIVSRGVGMPAGIVAGQAWECEATVVLADYQQAKTGALFAAATMAGAASAGADPEAWRELGARLGEAYQVADDLRDVAGDAAELGKPTGRDAALGRPSAARELGVAGAMRRLEHLVAAAIASIPQCPGAAELRAAMLEETARLLPKQLVRRAA
ncbi:MAG: polyprenyl synthetase family protein [Burkholderiales bacterium]